MANKGWFKPKDITGKRHGLVVAIRSTDKRAKDGSVIWIMKCDCGKTCERSASRFKKSKSCGCLLYDNDGQFVAKDLTGIVVNDCMAIKPTDKRTTGRYVIWRLRCNLCGTIFERPAYAITRKTATHLCPAYWEKYGKKRKGGRKPIPNNGAHVNALYGHYRYAARTREIEFKITKKEARRFFEGNCVYCGIPPKVSCTHPNLAGEYAWNGIDRIDNTKGYISDNCVSCCSVCNWAKGDRSFPEFKEWIESVYHHLF